MSLFDYIPEEFVGEVTDIVSHKEWDKVTKMSFLQAIVGDSKLLMNMCEEYLNNNTASGSSPPSFILLLPQNEQQPARLFLQRGDIVSLDKIIKKRKTDIQLKTAYYQWKKYYKEKKFEEEEKARPKLSDTLIEFTNNNEVLNRLPKETNIVFFGETGTGKSTLINSIINYLKHETVKDALQQKPTVAIPFVFRETTGQVQVHQFTVKANIKSDSVEKHEIAATGESATQFPQAYTFVFNTGTEKKLIRIIDTPGVGDTRGLEIEKVNMGRIMSFISRYGQIHAFCITVLSNESRLTLGFKYCLNQLLIQLHSSASKNIIFCLTKGGTTHYIPGDCFPILQEHIKKLSEKQKEVKINLNSNTVHTFENDCFRYICAVTLNDSIKYTEERKKFFEISWRESSKSTRGLLSAIASLTPHNLFETMAINSTRIVISALSPPLAEIIKLISLNQKIIKEKTAEIDKYLREETDLRGKLIIDQIVLKVQPLDYPVTVCTHEDCVTHENLFENDQRYLKTVPLKECHPHCYLEDVERETTNNTELKKCLAMEGETCRVCGCSWRLHKHIYYRYQEIKNRITDSDVQSGLCKNEKMTVRAHLFQAKIAKMNDELEKEKKKVREYCVEFACFLKAHALLQFNDMFGEYMDQLIMNERHKVSKGELDDALLDLIEAREDYDRQVEMLSANSMSAPRTLERINEMIAELKDMKVNGKILKEVQNLKLQYVKESATRIPSKAGGSTFFKKFLLSSTFAFKK